MEALIDISIIIWRYSYLISDIRYSYLVERMAALQVSTWLAGIEASHIVYISSCLGYLHISVTRYLQYLHNEISKVGLGKDTKR